MTDPRNPQPGSYRTPGYGAGAWEESRMAPDSGKASVRPDRPDAAGPAGWFPPPAGEAAPPVRHREPARSDAASQYEMEARPTSMYRVPRRPPLPERTPLPGRTPLPQRTPQAPMGPPRRPKAPMARPSRSTPDDSASRGAPPDRQASEPDLRWLSLTRRGPRHIPVVGPTEALRGRA